jgi:hypothetical protein
MQAGKKSQIPLLNLRALAINLSDSPVRTFSKAGPRIALMLISDRFFHYIVIHDEIITNVLNERTGVSKTHLFVCLDGIGIVLIYREHDFP